MAPLSTPNFKFFDPGTPFSDAAALFLQSAKAVQGMKLDREQQRLAERKQKEQERATMSAEARDTRRIGNEEIAHKDLVQYRGDTLKLDQGRFDWDKEKFGQEQAQKEQAALDANLPVLRRMMTPGDKAYNPEMAATMAKRYGLNVQTFQQKPEDALMVPQTMQARPSSPPIDEELADEAAQFYEPPVAPPPAGPTAPPPLTSEQAMGAPVPPAPAAPPPPLAPAPPQDPGMTSVQFDAPSSRVQITGKTPLGKEMDETWTPGSEQAGVQQYYDQAAERLAGMLPFIQDPLKQQYVSNVVGAMRSRIVEPEKAWEAITDLLGVDAGIARAALSAAASGERAKADAARWQANFGAREAGQGLQALQHLEGALQNFQRNTKTVQDVLGLAETRNALVQAQSKNGYLNQAAIYGFIRGMQPGDPRISNADYESVSAAVKSLPQQVQDFIYGKQQGSLSPATQKKLSVAITSALNNSMRRVKAEQQAFDAKFTTNPIYVQMGLAPMIEHQRQSWYGALAGDDGKNLPASGLPANGPVVKVPKGKGGKSKSGSVSASGAAASDPQVKGFIEMLNKKGL